MRVQCQSVDSGAETKVEQRGRVSVLEMSTGQFGFRVSFLFKLAMSIKKPAVGSPSSSRWQMVSESVFPASSLWAYELLA